MRYLNKKIIFLICFVINITNSSITYAFTPNTPHTECQLISPDEAL